MLGMTDNLPGPGRVPQRQKRDQARSRPRLTGTVVSAPPPTDVWVHPGVSVGASSIAGRGLIAVAPLSAGDVVVRFGGRLVSLQELHALFEVAAARGLYVDTIAVDRDVHLVLPAGTAAHFANHSCDPTLWRIGTYELATRRAIAPGDELTVDYASLSDDPAFAMTCTCGSANCRGDVTAAQRSNHTET
jgi:uncharacterized protein